MAISCGGAEPPREGAACEFRAAVVGGSAEESYLGLTPEQANAVVQVRFTRANGELAGVCSAVVVGSGRLLSARHCTAGEPALLGEVRIGPDPATPEHVLPVSDTFEHPELDLLAMTFDAGALPSGLVASIPAAVEALPSSLAGSLAVLAGLGLSDADSSFRRFAVERVTELDATSIWVDGGGVSGACFGDSGGPLLGRALDGLVRVYGVLGEGSLSCRGRDRYTRLDTDPEWTSLAGISEPADESAACDRMTEEGRCFGDVATWCEAGELRRAVCRAPEACGWRDDARGYRCGDPARDPCRGVPDSGTCDGSRALACRAGRLLSVSCDECADSCIIAPATGRVACAQLGE